MKPCSVIPRWSLLSPSFFRGQRIQSHYIRAGNFARKFRSTRSFVGGQGNGNTEGNILLVPGAMVATLLMLIFLHARYLYEDKKVDDMMEKGIEVEFSPDIKATFLGLLPLRSISCIWGYFTSLEIPVRLRPSIYKAWARAFHAGRLFPLNQRATRTIRNLHIENERVILEGRWREGFMAMAAIGAANIVSIKLYIEPELKTNRPRRHLLYTEPPDEKIYEPEGIGLMVKMGEEVAAFNMGSTVVLVFQAPMAGSSGQQYGNTSDFKFCIASGDRIKAGEAIGR